MRSRTSARISSTCTPVRSFTVPTPPGPAILAFRPLSAPLARHNSACSAAFSAQGGRYVLEKVLELFVSAKAGAPPARPRGGADRFGCEVSGDEPADGAEETEPPADPGCADDAAARQEARQR